MKHQTLNMTQMKHLKQLGIDTSRASVVLLFFDVDGNEVGWEVDERDGVFYHVDAYYPNDRDVIVHPKYFDAETGDYDHSLRRCCGVFTLQDMLNIMPKTIHNKKNMY